MPPAELAGNSAVESRSILADGRVILVRDQTKDSKSASTQPPVAQMGEDAPIADFVLHPVWDTPAGSKLWRATGE